MFGNISAEQMKSLAEIFQTFNTKSEVSEEAAVKQLLRIAPRFDLKKIEKSLREFKVFFNINNVQNDSVKFKVIQARLPWETMYQFGRRHPDCGPSLSYLEAFLKTYAGPTSPSLEMLVNLDKFSSSNNFKDLHHASVMGAKLDEDERTKLFTYIFASEDMKPLIKSYLDLPLSRFLEKLIKKWEVKPSSLSKSNPPFEKAKSFFNPVRPNNFKNSWGNYRTFYPSNQNPRMMRPPHAVSNLCRIHQCYGDRAFSCEGFPCSKASLFFMPGQASQNNDYNHQQQTSIREPMQTYWNKDMAQQPSTSLGLND
jgi:hypothetical protein